VRRGQPRGLAGRALEKLEEATGQVMIPKGQADLYEAVYEDYRMLNRQLDDIGWSVLDYIGGQPAELSSPHRRRVVQRARYVWMNDPQAGASVELMNDFCFGRGVPRPRCKDPKVQEVVDEAWDDPDNQEVLCSLEAQLALGTDLSLQSNVFLLMFDDGEDGKIKLSSLRHDDVTNAITDPDKRHRVLYYVVGASRKQVWNFRSGMYEPARDPQGDLVSLKPTYYEHWRNVELAEAESSRETDFEAAPDEQTGEGKVYHARINRYSEQVFGVPRFQRTLRWYSAYNEFVKTRIDMAQAAASVIMKRKIQGTAGQLARDASKLISRRGVLGQAGLGGLEGEGPQLGPYKASIIEENQSVQHEALNLSTGSADAAADAQMIRAPISAAERWTQAYYGDASNSSLATATSLELPILKAVESRQEVFEGVFRWFLDRVIEKAVDDGRISKTRDQSEIDADKVPTVGPDVDPADITQAVHQAIDIEEAAGRECVEAHRLFTSAGSEVVVLVSRHRESGQTFFRLCEAHEDKATDESDTERDLGYEFSMPSPLRRMAADLIGSIAQIAQVFDPNNSNVELSRALLTIALGEGLEVQDPADLVDLILPSGYQDPAVVAAQAAAQQQPTDGSQFPGGGDGNPYSAPMNSTMPEDQSGNYAAQEAVMSTVGRIGQTIVWRAPTKKFLEESPLEEHFDDLPEPSRRQAEGRRDEQVTKLFKRDVVDQALDALDGEHLLATERSNGGQ
jgi:hypothetical protein